MELIIQEIAEKIIKTSEENLINMLEEKKDISEFIGKTRKMLDEIGTDIVSEALRATDRIVKKDKSRKRDWHVARKADKKSLATIFGTVEYERTYYKNKKTKECRYLSDDIVGIEPHERMDTMLKAELIEKAIDLSYNKSGKKVPGEIEFTSQTVMNSIRELDSVANDAVEIKEKKKKADIIYIEADEDHVSNQAGKTIEPKLIYVHEGRKLISKDRWELKNKRCFTGVYLKSEDLWLEVANYLEEAYDIDKCNKIYLSGDGAKWIKEGLNWIKGSQYVLDMFHLSKYIKKATAHMPHTTHVMWKYINANEKKFTMDLFDALLEEVESESRKETVKEAKRYVKNHWTGIQNNYNEDYHGCSAEGHISHILSDRLSSRPLSWREPGVDQMARLRVFRENGGDIYQMLSDKKNENRKHIRIEKLDSRMLEKRANKRIQEQMRNIGIINIGKRTGAYKALRSLRGA